MKTIKQWLETLKEPYRSQALANLDENSASSNVKGLVKALFQGFLWRNTPEGFDYWSDVLMEAEKNPNSVTESAET